jgi:hypothetical protein
MSRHAAGCPLTASPQIPRKGRRRVEFIGVGPSTERQRAMSLLKTLSLEFIAGSLAAVIAEMAQIDAIAFTSAPQVRRFRDVARSFGREA